MVDQKYLLYIAEINETELSFKVDELTQKIERLEETVQDLSCEYYDLESNYNELQFDVQDFEFKIESLEEENSKMRESVKNLLGVIEAHELASLDCDGTGEKWCDCLEREVEKLKKQIGETE